MRRRLHAAVPCLLLSILLVFSLVPSLPVWASEPQLIEGTPVIEDTPSEGEQGSEPNGTEGGESSDHNKQPSEGEQNGDSDSSVPADGNGESETTDTDNMTPGEEEQNGEGGASDLTDSVQPQAQSEEPEESEKSEEPEDDGIQTMTPEEFYSEFRGTSWRFRDGEPVGASALAGSGVTWKEEGGAFVGSNGMRVEGAGAIGIDVSSHNGKVDWARVKAAGIDFAVIRCGFGTGGEDAQFLANVKGCLENGIPFGVYLYAYAWDAETATAEAEHLLDLLDEAGLDPGDLALPVFYDLEQEGEASGKPCGIDATGKEHPVSNATLASMGEAFAKVIGGAGYTPGFYANLNWWNNYLTDSTFNSYPRWVAQYNDECTYGGEYDYWQCMPNGSVSGVTGTVDVNFSYTEIESTWVAPVLDEVQAYSSGYKISWDRVPGASGYAVFRKPAGGSWGRIATVTSTNYTDKSVKSGTYYYTVRAYRGNKDTALDNKYSQRYWTDFDKSGVVVNVLATPKLTSKVATTSQGLKVSWSKVSGADGYAVYRKVSGGSYSIIGTTTSTSFTDTNQTGNKLYYTVRAYQGEEALALDHKYSAEYWSKYDNAGVSGQFLAAPELSGVEAASTGRRVSWEKVSGASGYAVYRKAEGGDWATIATTTSCEYVDTAKLSSGKSYRYTVRAYRGSLSTAKANKYDARYWSHYDTGGLGAVYLAAPSLSDTGTSRDGIKVSWSKVSGATGYAVFRKSSGGSWSMLDTTTSTSYTDETAASGKTYYYTVRAHAGEESAAIEAKYSAELWGGYSSAGVSGQFLAAPELSGVEAASTGRRVSWEKVSGASGYAVYRKAEGGDWATIATTTSCEYVDTAKLSSGKSYRYTVRAYRGSLSTAKANKYDARYWSHYDTGGLGAVYLSVPSMTGTRKTSAGLKSSWSKVSGATGYAVFRKSSGGSWSMLDTTTSTVYTDTSAKDMTAYYYTVRAYRGSVSTATSNKYDALYWGGYSSKGWAVYNGFQNPSGYYQVSCHSVSIKNQGKNQFGYRSSSEIAPDASKLECINTMITRAYDYLGTPYRWDYSCAPGVGVDCAGLVMQSLYACGMDLSPMNPWDHYYLGASGGWHSAYANYMWNSGKYQKLSFSKRQRGDIVSWNGHVAIYLGNNQIIEANGGDVHITSVYAYGTPRGVLRPFIED